MRYKIFVIATLADEVISWLTIDSITLKPHNHSDYTLILNSINASVIRELQSISNKRLLKFKHKYVVNELHPLYNLDLIDQTRFWHIHSMYIEDHIDLKRRSLPPLENFISKK